MTILNPNTNFQPLYVFCKHIDNEIVVKDEKGNRKMYLNVTIPGAIDLFRRQTKNKYTRYKIFCLNGY